MKSFNSPACGFVSLKEYNKPSKGLNQPTLNNNLITKDVSKRFHNRDVEQSFMTMFSCNCLAFLRSKEICIHCHLALVSEGTYEYLLNKKNFV